MKIKTVVLDAGHGYNTKGKRSPFDDTREWYLNATIATLLQDKLLKEGYSVIRTDDISGVKDISLLSRCSTSNKANADLFISIHHNAGLNGRHGGGTSVYWYSSKAERMIQARNLYNAIVNETGLRGNRAQTTIKYPFYVLKHTKAPAFLIENGFMDGVDDWPIIKTKEHAEKTANGIYNFIKSLG